MRRRAGGRAISSPTREPKLMNSRSNGRNACMPGEPYHSRGAITDGSEMDGGWFINLPYPNAVALGPFKTSAEAQSEFDRWRYFSQIVETF